MQFSILMSVYKNENPAHFKRAMDSLLTQTLLPDEIVLVRDGEVPEALQSVIDEYVENPIFRYCPLEKNVGLGNALNEGLKHTTYELVARMDTDDISMPDRFEKQIRFLEENPDVDMVGGQIEEFIGDEKNLVSKREVPLHDKEIKRFIKKRNPFNHMTVMFKKSAVLSVGSYMDLYYLEDYYLWCRLFAKGCVFANLPDVLVQARTSEDMYLRRGGRKYFKAFKDLEKYKKSVKLTNSFTYMTNLCLRLLQTGMPNFLRKWSYKHFTRKKAKL